MIEIQNSNDVITIIYFYYYHFNWSLYSTLAHKEVNLTFSEKLFERCLMFNFKSSLIYL